MTITVTADIVGSRQLADRAAGQRALDTAIQRVELDVPLAERPLRPTVGDEQQGTYPRLDAAMASLLLLQLALPDGIECRFGIGAGPVHDIASTAGAISEGPGWWAARAAIDRVHALEQRDAPAARTWVVAAPGDERAATAHLANAYLLARDEIVGSMSARVRRLTYGRCLGQTQRSIAETEGISQSAVSQALANAGSPAVVEGFDLLMASA